jgi:asparagine synthase
MLIDTVLSDHALARGYFKPATVKRMVSEHIAGTNDHQYVLWDLLLLERWHEIFIDQPIDVQASSPYAATLSQRG